MKQIKDVRKFAFPTFFLIAILMSSCHMTHVITEEVQPSESGDIGVNDNASHFFSSSIASGENFLGTLSFHWKVQEGSLILDYDRSDLPIRCEIETIQGCTSAVLLSIASDENDGGYTFLLCDLKTNSLAEPFDGRISTYSVNTLSLSEDLSEALFTTNRSSSAYYISNNLQEIRELFLETEQVNGMWLGNDLFLCVLARNSTGQANVDGYLYKPETDTLQQTIFQRPLFRSEQFDGHIEGALSMYGCAYGTYFENGILVLLDLRTGHSISTDLSYGQVKPENICYMGDEYFLATAEDGRKFLIDSTTGDVIEYAE